MITWYDLSEKEATKSCLGTLLIFFFFVFAFLYRDYEDRHLEKNGVWTALIVTEQFGDNVHYKFKLNNQAYKGIVTMSSDKRNSGNRFFMMVVPNEEKKRKIYDAVPGWFTLNAPPEGWKTCPTDSELRIMMRQDLNKTNSSY